MKYEKVKVIITGAANPHIPGYCGGFANDPDYLFDIVAIAEENEMLLNRVKDILKHKNVKFYTNWREMLDKHASEVDVVQIGSDNIHHFEQFKAAIRLNKHIYSTKVPTMNEAEGAELLELTCNYKPVVAVEYELRFAPQFIQAKEIIQSGRLGKIKSIYLSNISQSPCNYFPNWGDPLLSYGKKIPMFEGADYYRGGALTDHPHPFDLIRWLTGYEFETVYAKSALNQRADLKVEDHICITGKLTNSISYFINPSYSNLEEKVSTRRLLWPKSLECNLKIVGDKAEFMTDYFINPIFVMAKHHQSPDRYIVDMAPEHCNSMSRLETFVHDIKYGSRLSPTLADGLAAVKVMNGAYDSIYYNKEIILQEK